MASEHYTALHEEDTDDVGCCGRCCFRIGCDCGQSFNGNLTQITPNENRACTDLLMLGLFIVAVIGQIYVGSWCVSEKGANLDNLILGYNFQGTQCSGDTPYVVWPDVTNLNFRYCVSSCDESQNPDPANAIDGTNQEMITCGADLTRGYKSTLWLDTWCLPDSDDLGDAMPDSFGSFNLALGDILTARYSIYASGAVAILVCFAYITWIRVGGGCLIWSSLAIIAIGGGMLGGVLVYKADDVRDSWGDSTADAMKYSGILVLILDVIFLITMLCMKKRIQLAIELVGEAGRALTELMFLTFFPLLELTLTMAYFIVWIVISCYIFSVSVDTVEDIPDNVDLCDLGPKSLDTVWGNTVDTYTDKDWDHELQNIFVYHLFVGFWVFQFIEYWCFTVIAGAYSHWYFSPWASDEQESKLMDTSIPILKSMWTVTRYHLGTIAFGSLIIAIIQTIQTILAYLYEKTEEAENCVVKCIFSCVQCILECLKCCIDKINKNGFVFTTIYGTPYCSSSFKAFDLILSNLSYVAVITTVSGIFITLGKFVVAVGTTGIMLLAIQHFDLYGDTEISSLMAVWVVIFVGSYVIGMSFLSIYDTGIDTIFVCFVTDLEAHGKVPRFAHKDMAEIMGRYSEENQVIANRVQRMKTSEMTAGNNVVAQ